MIKSKSNSGENTFVKIHHFTSMICIDIQKCSVTKATIRSSYEGVAKDLAEQES